MEQILLNTADLLIKGVNLDVGKDELYHDTIDHTGWKLQQLSSCLL